MLKVSGVLLLVWWSGLAASSPTARLDNNQPGTEIGSIPSLNEINTGGWRPMKTNIVTDNIDKKVLYDEFRPDYEHPNNFHHPDSFEEERQLHHDSYVGSPESAIRAINNPLFFDTFDHGHMMTAYAQRREQPTGGGVPIRFRSIRPDFPFSDVFRRTSGIN